MTFSSLTPSICTTGGTFGATVTLVTTGTCTIQADQAGNGSFNPAPPVQQSFAVSKANQTITFGALGTTTLAQSPVTVGATATSSLAVTFSSTTAPVCTVAGTSVTLLTTGTCTIQADQAGNTHLQRGPAVQQSFAVTKADQTITFGALGGKTLRSRPSPSGATATSNLAVTFSTHDPRGLHRRRNQRARLPCVTTGTCTIQADQAGNTTYQPRASGARILHIGDDRHRGRPHDRNQTGPVDGHDPVTITRATTSQP